jgi:hypothetical protein
MTNTYARWLREVLDRRPSALLKKRGMLVVESGYVICTGNGWYQNCPLTPAGNIKGPYVSV